MIAADSAKSSEPLRSSVSVEEGRDLEQSVIPSKHVSGSGRGGAGGGHCVFTTDPHTLHGAVIPFNRLSAGSDHKGKPTEGAIFQGRNQIVLKSR